jgi:hypothetical protein
MARPSGVHRELERESDRTSNVLSGRPPANGIIVIFQSREPAPAGRTWATSFPSGDVSEAPNIISQLHQLAATNVCRTIQTSNSILSLSITSLMGFAIP